MKLSTRSTYGMRALVELALASRRGPVPASAIAKHQDLSVAYLEQLLHRLKQQGFVRSVRGPRGGYVLARDSRRVTMEDVVAALDGGRDPWNRKGPQARRRSHVVNGKGRVATKSAHHSARYAQCIAEVIWRCVHERLRESLGAVTLQDLCDAVRPQIDEPLEHRYVFHI